MAARLEVPEFIGGLPRPAVGGCSAAFVARLAAATAVYADTADDLSGRLSNCTSGHELRESCFGIDVAWAAAVDVSQSVPLLVDGRYVAAR